MTIKKDEWRLEYSKALDWMINNPDKDINEYEVQINDKTKFKGKMRRDYREFFFSLFFTLFPSQWA